MIGRRRATRDEVSDDASSPWATDVIEIDDGPSEFDWASIGRSTAPSDDDLDPSQGRPDRRRTLVGAATAVAVLVVGAVVLWPGAEDAEDADDPGVDAAPTTLATLPDPTDDADDADDVTSSVPTDDDPGAEDEGVADGDPAADDSGELLDPARIDDDLPAPIVIDLPAQLRALTRPTEVVMATTTGIVTLSLPSGRLTTSIEYPGTVGGAGVVVAPDAAAATVGDGVTIIPRTGMPIEVADSIGNGAAGGVYVEDWVSTVDGATAFRVRTFGPDGDETLLIGADGAVLPTSAVLSTGPFSAREFVRSNGRGIVNDGGGVYQITGDGSAQRIASGRAFAANGDFILVRECDEQLRCGFVVQNLITDERRPVVADLDLADVYTLDLAPDGSAILAIGAGRSGGETMQLVDLDLGTASVLTGEDAGGSFFMPGSAWVADSSGVLQPRLSGTGLTFIERSTGESIEVGADAIGSVVTLGLRYPDAELPAATGPITEVALDFSEDLAGPTGLDVVVLGSLSTMALLDLDDASGRVWRVPELPGPTVNDLFHVRDTVVALNLRDDGFAARPGSAEMIDGDAFAVPPPPRYPGPAQGLVWTRSDDAHELAVDHRLGTVDPSVPTGGESEIVLPDALLLGGDGRGGLVADAPGGVYAATASGTTRLTTGSLMALGANHALVRECDETLECRTLLLDRATGERTGDFGSRGIATSMPPDLAARTPGEEGPIAGTVSPDGATALIRLSDPDAASGWALSDFRSGTWEEIPAPVDGQPLIWSEDGSHLVYLSEAGVFIHERDTSRLVRVVGLGDVDAIVQVNDEFTATPPT